MLRRKKDSKRGGDLEERGDGQNGEKEKKVTLLLGERRRDFVHNGSFPTIKNLPFFCRGRDT